MAKQNLSILLLEDDELSALSLTSLLAHHGRVSWFKSLAGAQEGLINDCFDLALLDLDLETPKAGLQLIEPLRLAGCYVVVLSARREEEVVARAYQLGCQDFLVKPFARESLSKLLAKQQVAVNKKIWLRQWQEHFARNQEESERELAAVIAALLATRPILITGETGTGKTAMAKFIHQLFFPNTPWVHFNCAEIPENLIESELFGYRPGAFSGATKNKKGLLELAHGGVLFLDEVATMPMATQKKLLKAIEEKTFYPLGSEEAVKSQFQLISATCEDLLEKVDNKEFRADFYFRLDGAHLSLKPLRERRNEIWQLVEHVLKNGERRIVFEAKAKERIMQESWPGNFRQLQKSLELLQAKSSGIVSLQELENVLEASPKTTSVDKFSLNFNADEVLAEGLKTYIEKIETHIVESVFLKNQMRVRKTLQDLKISNSAFYRILSRSTLSPGSPDAE